MKKETYSSNRTFMELKFYFCAEITAKIKWF